MMNEQPERGATVIEYAMMTLVLVVSLVMVTNNLQTSQGEQISDAGNRIGMPEEYQGVVATATSSPPQSSPTDPAGSNVDATATMNGSASKQGAQKWTAVTEILVSDNSGNPILNAELTGVWVETFSDSSTDSTTASCTTDSTGKCSLSLWNLRRIPHSSAVTSVEFKVTNLSGEGVTPAAGVIGSSIVIAGV